MSQGSSRQAIEAFKSVLDRPRIPATVRLTRGRDADAACGQPDLENARPDRRPTRAVSRALLLLVRTLLNRPLATDPGTTFSHDNGTAHLLSAVLTAASGMPTERLARSALFGPLGIRFVRWLSDPHGTTLGSTGLLLHSRDLLTLGELYLRRGRRRGEQVVPSAWVRESTTAQVRIPGG